MKISWAHGLIIFFILYIGYLVGTVIKSSTVVHNLVVEDYYAHDIAYQKWYVDAAENRELLHKDLSIEVDSYSHQIQFKFGVNSQQLIGKVHFYRPSDKRLDQHHDFNLSANETDFGLATHSLHPGRWIIKIRWNDGVRDYYKEESIII